VSFFIFLFCLRNSVVGRIAEGLFEDPREVERVAVARGARDTAVPIDNAESLSEALEKNGVSYDYIRLACSDHSLLQNFFKHLSYYKLLIRYADEYLD